MKMIYLGLPGKVCLNEECGYSGGLAGWATIHLPIIGSDDRGEPAWVFIGYTGSYVGALWHWLKGDMEDE